jgi:hypothetical protein
MKREEEIAKYCEDMGFPLGSCSSINSIKALTASDAIKWADETMIERAVNWLVHNMASGEYLGLHDTIIKPDFITKFKKAMKGE